jgi:hypothetical protein
MSEKRIDLYLAGEHTEDEAKAAVLQDVLENGYSPIPGTTKDYRYHYNNGNDTTYVGLTFRIWDDEEQDEFDAGTGAYQRATDSLTSDEE